MLDAQDEARQILALLAVQSGRRLVEQQHGRLERQRAGKTDELLRAEREARHRSVAVAFELDEFDDRFDGGTVLDLLPAHARQEQHFRKRAGANARVPAGKQIVEHAHLRKQFAVLEGAGDAEPRYLMRRKTGDVAPAEADYPGAAIDAADAVEHAGLAGTVRADQR